MLLMCLVVRSLPVLASVLAFVLVIALSKSFFRSKLEGEPPAPSRTHQHPPEPTIALCIYIYIYVYKHMITCLPGAKHIGACDRMCDQ